MSARARKPGPLVIDGREVARAYCGQRKRDPRLIDFRWASIEASPSNLAILRAWLDRVEGWDRERRGKQ